jgi:hypothetical protein
MKIYALVCDGLILYIGKTKISLKDRESVHRCPSNKAFSKYIPDYIDWEIVLVDTVPDDETTQWERYYYDELMPLYNKNVPGRTSLEWAKDKGYATQKAYQKATGYAHCRAWRKTEKGKAYYREWQRKYRANKVE